MVNYKINVYLKHTEMENMYVREFIELVTQDINGNNFEFTVYEDDNVYDLTNKRVTMVVKSDSGTVIQENCQVVDAKQGKATITLPPDMLIENGPYMAEVQIWEGVNSRVTTLPFDYTVRLSLENDESIKADPRFSLLQVALQNVNDADGKSKEALKLSKEAKAICDDLVPKANTAAQNAQTALDRAESVVTQEELAQKVTLDGKDTKFDFIENKVVQDGLIYENRVVTNRVNSGIILTNNFTISMTLSASSKTDNQYFLGNYSDSRGLYLFCNNGVIKLIIDTIALDTIKPEPNEFYNVSIVCIEGECSVFINGIKYTHTVRYVPNNIRLAFGGYNGSSGELGTGKLKNVLIYNLPRAPQEIQNNFSVLNNLPSIKELHTTDSTGKTSILKLASDTDHVEDRSGRTQEQINRTFYKRMCKEIPSPSGEPITVKNGEEGYVLSAEIKGNTQLFKRAKGSQDEWIVIPNDEGRDTVAFEYKLDSTQAIISNNGEKYPIYATEEDKANKKVISMPFAEDKLLLNEDGSATWIDASNRKTLNDNEPWIKSSVQNAEANCFQIEIIDADNNGNSVIVFCDKLESVTGASTLSAATLKPNTCGIDGSRYLRVGVPKTVDTVEQMKEFAQNLNIIYRSKIQEITHIPKELVPTILTHNQTNILDVGGAVKPSSFKVTLPVDRIAELTARLEAVEAKTNTQPVNTAFVDETYAKSVNKIEEVIK